MFIMHHVYTWASERVREKGIFFSSRKLEYTYRTALSGESKSPKTPGLLPKLVEPHRVAHFFTG